ncbi:MAG: hypothetical protein JW856_06285, partial [Dehalococcoidales bacterium]|nr:hypothetical protein [Dehalococcoidales bacterium]
AVGLVVVVVLLVINMGNLSKANTEIADQKDTIAGLQTDLSSSQAQASNLQTQLTVSEAEVADLEVNVASLEDDVASLEDNVADLTAQNTKLDSDLRSANSQISSLQSSLTAAQNTNTTLTTELKKIKYPKNFTTAAELTDWLVQDNTNTAYATANPIQKCFILQVRALQSGYLLPAYVLVDATSYLAINFAMIGESMYLVDPDNDDVILYAMGFPIMTTYPIPAP